MKKFIQNKWEILIILLAIVFIALFISCSGVSVVVEIPEIVKDEILNEFVTITTKSATPSEHKTQENPIVVEETQPFDFQIKKADGIKYVITFRNQEQPPKEGVDNEEHYKYSIDLSKTASGTYAIIITVSRQVPSRSAQREEEQVEIWIQVQNDPPGKPGNVSPEDGATNQPRQDLLFNWEAVNDLDEEDEVFYLFLLGTSEENLTLQATPTQNTYIHPGPLEYDTQYFWQVLAEDGKKSQERESTAGDIWQFTTEPEPPKVTLTVQSQPQSGGDVKIGEGVWSKAADVEVYEGTSKTISSRSAPDYLFDGWYIGEDLISRDTSYDVHVEEDSIYQARFVEIGAFQPPEMIYVAKTSYQRSGNEVTLTYGYRISKTEVTINQYHAFQNDSQSSVREANQPVAMVNWLDAIDFCNWLSVQDGLAPAYDNEGNLLSANGQITQDIKTVEGYRLPTEAEWELAARGGGWPSGDYQYSGSDTIGDVAWYAANSNADGTGPRAQSVAGLLANDRGLHDMSGNVREWCHDWHGAYPQSHQEDPVGPAAGTQRVIRGGGWDSAADTCLVDARDRDLPDEKAANLGFRVAKTERPSEGELVIRWKEDNPPAPPHRPPIEGDKTVEEIVANKPVASLVVTVNDEETIIEEPQHVEETEAGEHVYAAPVENLQQDEDNPVEVVAKGDNDQPSNEIKRNFPWKPIITNVQAEVGECAANQCVVVVRFNSNQEISQIIHQIGGSEEETTINDPFSFPDENGIYEYSFSVTVDQGEFTIYFSAYGVNGQDAKSVSGFCDCNIPPKIDEEDYTVDVDECIDNECQVTIGIWVDQLLTHISIQTDEGDPQQQEAGDPASVLNRHRYEIVTTVGDGQHTITVQGINANGTSNPLTVTVDCNCVIPTPDQPVISDLDYFLHECVESECMLSIIFTSNQPIDKVQAQEDDNERVDYEDLDPIPDQPEGEYRYQFFMSVTAGEHTIWFEGLNDNGRSNTLVITVDCECETPTPPTIAFDPEPPATSVADEIEVSITSDQILEVLRIWNNSEPNVIESPVYEEDGDAYKYNVQVGLQEGFNELEIQGENENGISNLIGYNTEKGEPPVIAFAEQPPSQVTNCVEEECQVTILISCDGGGEITHQVGDEEPITIDTGQPDLDGNYPRGVILKKGINTITFTAKNRFGTSDPISCTIECICDSPPTGYTKEQLIGETEIPKPIGFDFYPDYQQQRNFLNVLTKTAEDDTEIQHGELTGGLFMNKYPDADLPDNPIGYAFEGSRKTNLLLLPDKVQRLESDKETLTDLPLPFPEGQTAVPGQLDHDNGPGTTSVNTQDSNGHSTLNVYNGLNTDQFPFGTVVVGLHNMHQASDNQTLKNQTAMGGLTVNPSGSRDSVQRVFTLDPVTGQTNTLFEIPLSHGTVIDILPDIFDDYTTVQFIVTTVKNETEYWVNIYNQAGERLYAFKTHDLSDLQETSGETIFYKVIKATDWPDGKLYIMHSEFPGVQIWEPEE